MLRFLRQNASSWIIKFLLSIIVLVFVFMGIGSYDADKNNVIAVVNDIEIPLAEYRNAYNTLKERFSARFGKSISPEIIEMLQLPQQALKGLIDNVLLMEQVKKLGLRISNQEVSDTISQIPIFQISENFNQARYLNVLQQNRLSPQVFEANQKKTMLLDKLRFFIEDSVKLTNDEKKQWKNWSNTLIDIDYALFSPEKYSKTNVSEKQVELYYEKHKDEYKTEAKCKVRYICFNPLDYIDKIEIKDDEILDYYNENMKDFITEKTVKARHILIKTDKKDSLKKSREIEKKANAIYKIVKSGSDFEELAKKYSEGPSGKNGGYLKPFKKNEMVKPFADKAFSMKTGDISKPVKTIFGWHIIKVEKINEKHTKSFKDAKKEISVKLAENRAKNIAFDEAYDTYEISYSDNDLVKTAQSRNLKIITTDFFKLNDKIKNISNYVRFTAEAFEVPVNEISQVLDFYGQYYILQPIEKISETVMPLKEVREVVLIDATKDLKDKKAKEDANNLLKSLKKSNSIVAECKKLGIAVQNTGFFTRKGPIPSIGTESEISKAAFMLPENKKLMDSSVLKGKKGYYVISLKERKISDTDKSNKEDTKLFQSLLLQKRRNTFNNWIAQLKAKSTITIKESLLK